MRHQPIDTKVAATDTSVAAVWPSFEEVLRNRQPLALEPEPLEIDAPATAALPAPAAPDVPTAVGGMIVASYAALLTVFFAFFAGSPLAFFSITIGALFVGMYFAVPRIFFAVEADPSRRPSFLDFWYVGIETLTGRTSGKDALIQMLIVPVFLSFGLLTMGIIVKIYVG
jgi:hypothetical protein